MYTSEKNMTFTLLTMLNADVTVIVFVNQAFLMTSMFIAKRCK